MMLELLLLEIHKLDKFSGPIPKISNHVLLIHMSWQMEACFITKPNVVCRLHMLVSVLFGHLSNYKKWFSLVAGYLDVLSYLYFARELLLIFPQNAVHYCWSLHFVFCRKFTDRPLWTFSITGFFFASTLAVDLPNLSTTVRYIQHRPDPVFKNLLINHS